MSTRRYLCSELVALRMDSCEVTVNLEEIWENGAIVEAEIPIEEGTRVEIRSGQAFFAGKIAKVEQHQFGWRGEIEFSPLTPWSADRFLPKHLLDVSDGRKETTG